VKDKQGNPGFTARTDWRCTTKPGKLYIHLFKWPSGTFEVSKVKGTVKKAYMLADAKHAALKVKQEGDRVTVTLPSAAPDKVDSVLVLATN
jgi:alpha-L-fucosidase